MSAQQPEFRKTAHSVPQNWASLARYLASRGAALGSRPPRQFAGGYGNLNYLIEIDGRPAVLRRPPAGRLPPGANDMAREYRILSSLWREFPLAPRAMFFCDDVNVLGAPFQIIEYRSGMIIRDSLAPDLSESAEIGGLLSRQLVETLVALHAVDPGKVGLETLGRPAGFLARTIEGWAVRGAAVLRPVDLQPLPEVIDWLRRRVPNDAASALIHCDFKLDNMILAPGTLAPVAVIDWDMGTRGDPLWDLAVLLSYWAQPGDPPCLHRVQQMPTAKPGFWRRNEVLAAYLRLSHLSLGDFTFYRVLSVLRSAVVFLQLHDRFGRIPESRAGRGDFEVVGRELLDYSFEISRGRAD